jgi:hypothetical protein
MNDYHIVLIHRSGIHQILGTVDKQPTLEFVEFMINGQPTSASLIKATSRAYYYREPMTSADAPKTFHPAQE